MKPLQRDPLIDKITEGINLAIRRMIERTQKEDGELVVSRNGKVVRIKARSISFK
jgi:hypothetical protein